MKAAETVDLLPGTPQVGWEHLCACALLDKHEHFPDADELANFLKCTPIALRNLAAGLTLRTLS